MRWLAALLLLTARAAEAAGPQYLDRAQWPVVFDLPEHGIAHHQMAVVTDEKGRRQYQSAFTSAGPGQGGAPCCYLQLWVEEGAIQVSDAKALMHRLVEYDAGKVVADHKDGEMRAIPSPRLLYMPFTGTYLGQPAGCFVYLGETQAHLPTGADSTVTYHGYYCRQGSTPPAEAEVAAVMANLRPRGA